MRYVSLFALSAVVLASTAHADGVDRAPLRGSAVYQVPSYPVDFAPRPEPLPTYIPKALPSYLPPPPPDVWALPFSFEIGARYWLNFGKLAKNLYDIPTLSSAMVSRLTFGGMTGHAAELYGGAEHPIGVLIKGYVGLGGLSSGSLKDEDFTPFIDPYSSTLSEQRDGQLRYATFDLGYRFWKTPQAGFAGFVGYSYLAEKANAFGCAQVATNPFVCVPAITGDVLGITEDARFHSLRLGVAGDVRLYDCFRFTAEAAWVPFTNVTASDAHWLRIGSNLGDFSGPIPESGHGNGVQLEAALAYQATANFSVGVGARYWRLQTQGIADFSGVAVGFMSPTQPLNFTTERYGVFLQGAYRL